MALSWVSSEGIADDDDGVVHDLTIRSFGILRAVDTPAIEVTIEEDDGPAVRGSDAVFVAVAAAAWLHAGCPTDWPTGTRWR
jgi:CO/xanthine dehydrogenase Mo-binding subunit